jgi:hypothetical protein
MSPRGFVEEEALRPVAGLVQWHVVVLTLRADFNIPLLTPTGSDFVSRNLLLYFAPFPSSHPSPP